MGRLPILRNFMGFLEVGEVVREICTGGRLEEKGGEKSGIQISKGPTSSILFHLSFL